jgi:uncharacterized protein YaaR (DUF327 family)
MAPVDPLRLGLGLFTGPGRSSARRRGKPGQPAADGPGAPAGGSADGETAGARLPSHILPLADEVEQAGSELARDPAGPLLERYRRAVRRFLDATTHEALRVKTEKTLGLAQRVFATVTRTDLLLADLADAVLGRQRDLGRIRALVDQLKGILLDLYR